MVRFNEGASLDTSQVSDRRGSGGSSGGIGVPLGVGGGGVGLIVVLVIAAIQFFGGGGSGSGGLLQRATSDGGTVDAGQLASQCRTGADANTDEDCRAVAFINSVQDYWANAFQRSNRTYRDAVTVFYSGSTSTGCGVGRSGMGPFYCPADQQVYIDLTFWQTLKTDFKTDGGVFAQGYVLAHEYGHHVQNLLKTSDRVQAGDSGPTSGSVRLELQADCYAGVWAKNATTTPGPDGQILISDITQQDLADALDTASKIGDDYIQTEIAGGPARPSQYTHGTSAQRQKWLRTGYDSGDPASCDTFGTSNLG